MWAGISVGRAGLGTPRASGLPSRGSKGREAVNSANAEVVWGWLA